ncbi:redoxin domain-containing protein [Variovorax dokdonensis]|uniref:Redoxin domain-containing protein n=1 Tax=Variovorax dokdonensis TaxID=344883 RepID=A0ABT7N8B3_9BURK|nr:redoxin domain-containing protein [Variovorax dokdonensis]MDM0044183.1 redoxin domain-containing protein [Variovorax dokdonensis]
MTSIDRRSFSIALAAGALASPWSARAATGPDLPDLGAAPEFTGLGQWFNSAPLTLASLRGKVVLVDFWTFGCVNCANTMPHVVRWYDRYAARGFVVVGIHTPEFGYEKLAANVQTALGRFDIRFPVAQDNDFATWKAWRNQYWPAFYLVDQAGRVRRRHFGEGEYAQMDQAISALLA